MLNAWTKSPLLTRRSWLASAAGFAFTMMAAAGAKAQDIKIGILHSLSGTMAISETTLKDVMLMLIEQQNKKGGVIGKKLEAPVPDPQTRRPFPSSFSRSVNM